MERLRSHRDFVAVLKGRRTMSEKDVIAHILIKSDTVDSSDHAPQGDGQTPRTHRGDGHPVAAPQRRLGLAVSKAVGNAVTRNRVKRRLRVLARRYEEVLPEHCDIILRAKPSAARTRFPQLEPQVARLFSKAAALGHRGAP